VKYLLAYVDGDPIEADDLDVTTTSLPAGQVGIAYPSTTMSATGGTPPYTWEAIEALPGGLSISAGGVITGTPTTPGNFTPRLQVADSADAVADSGTLPITIVAAGAVLTITTNSIPSGQVGVAYSAQLNRTGGVAPFVWSVQTGSLPAGLSLNASSGLISGTPTTAGTSALTFRITDDDAVTDDSGVYNLTISAVAGVSILTSVLSKGEVGTAYSRTLTITGGDGDYTVSLIAGSLPTGITLSVQTLSGTPTTVQTRTFTIRAVDGNGLSDEQDLSLEIVAAGALDDPHEYFETLAGLPEALSFPECTAEDAKGCSLLSQAQLDRLTPGVDPAERYWTYSPGTDTRADKQDAAKMSLRYGRKQEECTSATGKADITGPPGTLVPKGAILANLATGYRYTVSANYTLGPDGHISKLKATGLREIDGAAIASITPVGSIYLSAIPVNTVLTFVTTPAGLDSTAPVIQAVATTCTYSLPTNMQLKWEMGYSTGSVLITWDMYATSEWRSGLPAGFSAYKTYNLRHGATPTDEGNRWTIVQQISDRTSDLRTYCADMHRGMTSGGKAQGVNPLGKDWMTPTGNPDIPARTYRLRHSVWTRWWVEIKFAQDATEFTDWSALVCDPANPTNPCTESGGTMIAANTKAGSDGKWHMISAWVADEERDPVAVLYRVPVWWGKYTDTASVPYPYLSRFDFEFNTSDVDPVPGASSLYCYARGFHTLRNYTVVDDWESDTVIFQKPVRG
jgi:hypothetical protein